MKKTPQGEERRRADRVPMNVPVEFIVDADLVQARSVDLSETGLRFETKQPIPILLRMAVDGAKQERRAHLVWARSTDGQGMAYGLQFVDGQDYQGLPPTPDF